MADFQGMALHGISLSDSSSSDVKPETLSQIKTKSVIQSLYYAFNITNYILPSGRFFQVINKGQNFSYSLI